MHIAHIIHYLQPALALYGGNKLQYLAFDMLGFLYLSSENLLLDI